MRRFVDRFALKPEATVLDVGGSPFIWELSPVLPKRLVLLNLNIEDFALVSWVQALQGDACSVPVPDKAFDVVFSNSVIEHLGSTERQGQFARECYRCGKEFFIQTPNKWFPVDTHTLFLFVHWWPRVFRRILKWSPRALISKPSSSELEDWRNLRLLDKAGLQQLFPDAEIISERFCGIPKSLIAVSRRRATSP
jgi:SAM-dependent methyltransferase